MSARICLYFVNPREVDRWVTGDRFLRPFVRRIVRGRPPIGGVERVILNLCLGLQRIGANYVLNLPFSRLRAGDLVGVVGRCRDALAGYSDKRPIVAGPCLMTSPAEWPDLCEQYSIAAYLQHSEWARLVYVPYFGEQLCRVWPVGIDTEFWRQNDPSSKDIDILIYNKIRWRMEEQEHELVAPIRAELARLNLRCAEVRYGKYCLEDYQNMLQRSRAMLFLCEHESQGLAYQEALSSGVPILAWDQGWCLDPNFLKDGKPILRASSTPLWDERCGEKFSDVTEFSKIAEVFFEKLSAGTYAPRDYVMENLTLEKCSQHYVQIMQDVIRKS